MRVFYAGHPDRHGVPKQSKAEKQYIKETRPGDRIDAIEVGTHKFLRSGKVYWCKLKTYYFRDSEDRLF